MPPDCLTVSRLSRNHHIYTYIYTRRYANVACIHKCGHMHRKRFRRLTETSCTGLAGHTTPLRKVFVVPLPHDVRCKGSSDPYLILIPLTRCSCAQRLCLHFVPTHTTVLHTHGQTDRPMHMRNNEAGINQPPRLIQRCVE